MDNREPFRVHQTGDGLQYLLFDGWQSLPACERRAGMRLNVGFSTRSLPLTTAAFDGLNFALHVGDQPQQVVANRERLAAALDLPLSAWTCAEQVHGNEVFVIREHHKGAGHRSAETAIPGTDGLLTNESDIWLTSFYADCVPLYFFDPDQFVIGVAHAGWRGTANRIAAEMVARMEAEFSSRPDQLLALIGPSIGGCCYEVDELVRNRLLEALELDAYAVPEEVIGIIPGTDKYRVDLKRCNQMIMMKAGILPRHIEISQWCTSCQPNLFFSHRKQQARAGRMVAWICLHQHPDGEVNE